MGQRLQLDWQQSAEELKHRYLSEQHPQRPTRLQALWLLRQGKRMAEVVEIIGVH